MLNALPGDSYSSPLAKLNDSVEFPLADPRGARSHALKRFSRDEAIANPWREINSLPRQEPIVVPTFEHAEPVTTLRDRDFKELETWFDRPDMSEIEEDVNRHLLMLFPEPCWEDDDFEFLTEHL